MEIRLTAYTRDSSNFPRRRLVSKMFNACMINSPNSTNSVALNDIKLAA